MPAPKAVTKRVMMAVSDRLTCGKSPTASQHFRKSGSVAGTGSQPGRNW
jgi:hypothetical protein